MSTIIQEDRQKEEENDRAKFSGFIFLWGATAPSGLGPPHSRGF
jgi:hypothetical protein